jgi:diaminopropionate ammonia-lyase
VRVSTPAPAAALAFHRALPGYAPTPLRELPALAAELGVASVAVKDESARLGLPAFKVLGASWAVEQGLRRAPDTRTLVAASAGNHGRAVAHVAARRGLACRVFLPDRARPARRAAIAGEGAEVVVVPGDYEEAVRRAAADARRPGVLEVADVGTSPSAHDVIDGYATLFAELPEPPDVLLVPVGVGSLAAAAARYGAANGARVVGVEPATAACLTASLAAGAPTRVPTPGTVMAGMDCAEVSPAAWPALRAGIASTVLVADDEVPPAVAELAAAGLRVGECAAATLVAVRRLDLAPGARVVLVATEGPTGG